MPESKADLLLHPIRMRIIQTMVDGKRQTAQQIAEHLSEVPPATLYRHLNKLSGAGVLEIVDQRQVRGAVEKVYALAHQNANLGPDDLAQASREDLMRYFTTFVATLMGDFSRYLSKERVDLFADGVGFRQAAVYLSDEEFREMVAAMSAAVRKYQSNEPAPNRTRRLIASVVMPDVQDR